MALRLIAFWDCGFESLRWHGCLSLVSVVCCQVDVSASGWSLVQRSPSDWGVSDCDLKTSTMRSKTTRAVQPWKKIGIAALVWLFTLFRGIFSPNWYKPVFYTFEAFHCKATFLLFYRMHILKFPISLYVQNSFCYTLHTSTWNANCVCDMLGRLVDLLFVALTRLLYCRQGVWQLVVAGA